MTLTIKHRVVKPYANEGVDEGKVQQAFTKRKRENTENENKVEVSPTEKSKVLGIVSSVMFLLTFTSVYISARYNHGDRFNLNNFTLSEAILMCNKPMAILLVSATAIVMTFYFREQNYYFSDEMGTNFIISFMYIIVAMWMLLFFLTSKSNPIIHFAIAIIIIVFIVASSLTIYDLYNRYYESNKEMDMLKTTSTMVMGVGAVTAGLIFVYKFFQYSGKKIGGGGVGRGVRFAEKASLFAFSLGEMAVILFYVVFLGVCSTLPALPKKNNMECVFTENPME